MTSARVFLILFFLLFGFTSQTWAQGREFRRLVELEWEAVDGSPYYDIEITKSINGEKKRSPQIFRVRDAQWRGQLKAGLYQMRLRSYDLRGVPGNWSDPSEFWVKLNSPELVSPIPKSDVPTDEEKEAEIKFEWKPVEGAAQYKIEVESENGKIKKSDVVSETSVQFDLLVGLKYRWKVSSLLPNETEGDSGPFSEPFTVVGKRLVAPKIETPSSEFVRTLKWEKSDYASVYEYSLSRLDRTGQWKHVEKGTTKRTTLRLKEKYPGGQYRLAVRARGEGRAPSEEKNIEFKVYDGDRSPAAIREAQLREAIEKPTNFYLTASYFLTQMNHTSVNYETGTGAAFNAIGGTGRIGAGYFIPESKWGVFGIVDLSGFTIGTQNFTFGSMELHTAWRTYIGLSTQLRVTGGAFLKEVPQTIANEFTGTYEMSKVTSTGPHIGFDLWKPLGQKIGIQTNARLYYNMMGLQTPNNQPIVSTLSYQFGLLGSLKLSRDLMGFAGYAYRIDNAAYNARVDRSAANATEANPGDVNTIQIQGHYLNLMLEWGF